MYSNIAIRSRDSLANESFMRKKSVLKSEIRMFVKRLRLMFTLACVLQHERHFALRLHTPRLILQQNADYSEYRLENVFFFIYLSISDSALRFTFLSIEQNIFVRDNHI